MKSPKTIYLNMSMQRKLLIAYLPIVILAIFSVGFFASQTITDDMYEQSFAMNRQALEQEQLLVHMNLDYYDTFMKSIYLDTNSLSYFVGSYKNAYEELNQNRSMISHLGKLLINHDSPLNLSVIRDGNYNEQVVNNFDRILDPDADSMQDYLENSHDYTFQIYNSLHKNTLEWYQHGSSLLNGQWLQVESDQSFNNLSYIVSIRELPRAASASVIGVLKLTVRIEDILSVYYNSNSDEAYPYLLFGQLDKKLYVHPSIAKDYEANREQIQAFVRNHDTNNQEISINNLVIAKKYLSDYDVTIVSITSVASLMQSITKLNRLIATIAFIAVVIVSLLTFIIARFYVQRIKTIVTYLHQFQDGDFNATIPYMNEDEVGYLAEAYNDMSGEIQFLINKVYRSELEIKEIEYSLLQHQINPHFLYNSLSSIGRLAEIGNKETIRRMIEAMVAFYRLTLNNGENIITISDEIAHIKSYLNVYDIRMGERLNVHFDLDESLFDYKTIKIILQPFVENILEHAFYRNKSLVTIIIRLYKKDDAIYFEVVDDGIGMSREQLNTLNSSKITEHSGYAIGNVKRRLSLHYNDDALRIYSRLGIGTQVIIRIPTSPANE